MSVKFDNTYVRLPERFYAPQIPAQVPAPQLVRINASLAGELGIDPVWLAGEDGVAMLSGQALPPGAEPIAQAYAGHQFGHFVPQLGDGRAILIGEVVDAGGRRRDLVLKGAGRTAYSRGGDGRAALGPVLREYLVSEAIATLGVPSTRALAAVTTGGHVMREDLLPGAIFTRVAASHLRVGTFQFFAARQDEDALRVLVATSLERHYPEAVGADNPALALLENVIRAQADLVAAWLSLGFIHGVMNTDNVAISGETIDFGPCAFMDTFHPAKVFSSIDRKGRYAWGNQPTICQWNLTRLAETLLPLIDADPDRAVELAEAALGRFPTRFEEQHLEQFRRKLGLWTADAAMVKRTLDVLAAQEVDFTLFFRRLTQVAAGESAEGLRTLFNVGEAADRWLTEWRDTLGEAGPQLDVMRAANPVLIPRNHRVEEAIQAGVGGDFSVFHRLVDAWAKPYAERTEFADLEEAPLPEQCVTQTFCGT